MKFGIKSKEFHNGPGHITLEFVHFAITDPLPPVTFNFQDLLTGLKQSKFFKVGYQNDPERYGPYLLEKITTKHFEFIKSEELLTNFSMFLHSIQKTYNKWWIHDTDFLVDKLALNTRFIPTDQTKFYYFTPSTPFFPKDGIPGLTDAIIAGFDFFYCVLGYNQTNVYLFSVWYD